MLWLLLACSGAPDAPTAATLPPSAASAAPVWANVAPARVLEAVHGDGRSYLKIAEASYTFWVSVPKLDVAAGDHVKLGLGSLHEKLHSTELTRDFENITEIADAAKTEPPTPAETISPPEGGVSIAELYAKKAELSGKPVTVRGRVVKVSKGIFDKNWYHLRDGTGEEGTNDLTVTTLADVELGDVVVATAPLTTDRDLGFGYFYPIILEDAGLTADGAAPPAAPAAPEAAPAAAEPAQPPTADAAAPAAPLALVPLVPRPRQAGLPSPPLRQRLSLEVGAATPEQVDALVRSRGLTCTTAPSPRRTTIQTVCDGTIPTSAIESGTVQGVVREVRFSRTDTGPIHSIHTSVRYSLSARAAQDYQARSAHLVATLGKPAIERPFDASRLENKLVRYAAEWNFDTLDVSVSLFRTGTDYYTLSESWSVPGIEAGAFERAASGGHGAGPARPAGWNPHVRP